MSTVSPYRDSELRFSEPSIGKFAGKVYSWMAIMLGVTAATSFFAIHAGINQWLEHNSGVFGLLLILELALVMLFSGFRKHFSFTKGVSLLGAYTVLNGLTLSAVLNHYKVSTLGVALLSSAGLFGMASVYGFVGKSLAKFGNWLAMGLITLLVSMIVNLLLGSQLLDYVLSSVAVGLFTVLAAYDAQMVRRAAIASPTNLNALDCALEIYLDFLNIFLNLLRLFGGGKGKD